MTLSFLLAILMNYTQVGIHDRLQRTESYIHAKSESMDSSVIGSLGRQPSLTATGFGYHSNTPFRNQAILIQSMECQPLATIPESTDLRDTSRNSAEYTESADAYLEVDPNDERLNRNSSDLKERKLSVASQSMGTDPQRPLSRRLSGRRKDSVVSDLSEPPQGQSEATMSSSAPREQVLEIQISISSENEETEVKQAKKTSIFAFIGDRILRNLRPSPLASEAPARSFRSIDDGDRGNASSNEDEEFESEDQSSESEMSSINDEDIDLGDEVSAGRNHLSLVNQKDQYYSRSFMGHSDQAGSHSPKTHERKRRPWTNRKDGGINSRVRIKEHGSEIYYVGIIDILQQYNFRKKTENLIKVCSFSLSCYFVLTLLGAFS